jgi:endoglucanase
MVGKMKKHFAFIPIALNVIFIVLLFRNCVHVYSDNDDLARIKHKLKFESTNLSLFPKALIVKNNRIETNTNSKINLVGLMAVDFAVMHKRTHSDENNIKEFVNSAVKLHAKIIRIPVHPRFWVNDPDYLWRYLDPVVEIAGKNGIYVDISWQCIGNIDNGFGSEMPEKDKSKEMTNEFWNLTSAYFNNVPNVLFEIFNEPCNISANAWEKNAREIVKLIRINNRNAILIVSSPEYSSNLQWLNNSRIIENNIAYSVHIYPNHGQGTWDYLFGNISKQVPVIMTEWGFMVEKKATNNKDQWILYGNENSFGNPLIKYMDSHNINWIACFYDYEWEPPMMDGKTMKLNRYGKFVSTKLSQYD